MSFENAYVIAREDDRMAARGVYNQTYHDMRLGRGWYCDQNQHTSNAADSYANRKNQFSGWANAERQKQYKRLKSAAFERWLNHTLGS